MKYLGAEQAMVVGEGRPYLVAIVSYDGGMTAEQKTTFEKNLAQMNEGLADHERVRRCVVLDRLFSLERGELTRTFKLRRAHIEKIHGEALWLSPFLKGERRSGSWVGIFGTFIGHLVHLLVEFGGLKKS